MQETDTLRGLNAALPDVIEKRLIGEVISVEVSTLRQRLLVNRGGGDGVYKTQPVVTAGAAVVPHRPFSLGNHPDHRRRACPARAGAALRRTIALGTGRATSLALCGAELRRAGGRRAGHLGLGQVFPLAFPWRGVQGESRSHQPLAQIEVPLASRIRS